MGNQNAYIQDANLVMSNATMEVNTTRYSANSRNGDFTQTLVPDNPSNKLRIAFDLIRIYKHNNRNSYVRVYNGPSTNSGLLIDYRQNSSNYTGQYNDWSPTVTSSHYTGALTIQIIHGSHHGYQSASFSGEITSVGTPTKNITWDIIGTSQVFDLDYSTDNGVTWHRIINDYSQTGSTGSYSWQVPNLSLIHI